MNLAIFKPSSKIFLVFAFFSLILVGAQIQSWGFCKECGVEKPILYDSISGISFWIMNVFLSLPITIFYSILPHELGLMLNLVYYYFLSSLLVFFLPYLARFKMKKAFILAGCFLVFAFLWNAGLFRTSDEQVVVSPNSPTPIVWIGFFLLPLVVVMSVYGAIIIGGFVWVRSKRGIKQRE